MINTVVLVGRLTQNPMLKVTPNTGTAVANFTKSAVKGSIQKG